nr:hypothetical protein [Candidatus Freyarchaeota archaeon]
MIDDYKTHSIICECCGEKIACPTCGNTERLLPLAFQPRTLALCYDCGAIFWADSGEILTSLVGDKSIWGATAMALVFSLKIEGSRE